MDTALAVARRLGPGEAGQAGVVDPAEFAVEISGLHSQLRKRCDGARILIGLVEPGPGLQLYPPVVDARGHAIAVELDLVHPPRPCRRLLDRLRKLERDEWRKGRALARRADT